MKKKVKRGRPVGSGKKDKANISALVDSIKENLAAKALDKKTSVSDKIAILQALRN